ncbi:hypothetical protein AALO_G00199800 [Alosa alosa]|uniref:Uncharacterized protein n=1 Tax=Alosa alosa TaxID=278164 RepID=A0AAV6G546_9TELE|nr:hypothetical protein AALO_G00199800 [Alosa alosa]
MHEGETRDLHKTVHHFLRPSDVLDTNVCQCRHQLSHPNFQDLRFELLVFTSPISNGVLLQLQLRGQ